MFKCAKNHEQSHSTVVEKSFRTPLRFYTISNIIMKYLWKNLFCVSKGAAALDRQF